MTTHKANQTATAKGEAPGKFVKAMQHILSVPKEELAKREAAYQQERATKKASRKAKTSALLLFTFCFLPLQSVTASPEERAQMFKALVLQKLVEDGWQLVQETHSLIIVERPAEGSFGFWAQAFMTGANGTKPVIRWSVTITPTSENRTHYLYSGSVNSQNAFGQMKSWPLKNRKDKTYMEGVLDVAAAGLPAKYKGKGK